MPRGRKPTPGPHTIRHERAMHSRKKREAQLAKMPDTYHDLARKIEVLLHLRSLTQQGLADRCNAMLAAGRAPAFARELHQTRISKWLHRQGEPSLIQTVQLADALDVPRAYLLDPTRTEPPHLPNLEAEKRLQDAIELIGGPAEAYARLLGAPSARTVAPARIVEADEVIVPLDRTDGRKRVGSTGRRSG